MNDRSDLLVLAERIEAAEGPDRELDARLWQFFSPNCEVLLDGGVAFGPGLKRPPRYGPLSEFPLDGWDDYEGIAVTIGAPLLTASIDAADALLARLGLAWSKSLDGHVYVQVPGTSIGCRPSGATLALRLCAGAARCVGERT